jgi:hypothetical protein
VLRVLNIRTIVPLEKPLEVLVAKKLRCSRSDIEQVCIVRPLCGCPAKTTDLLCVYCRCVSFPGGVCLERLPG